MLNVATQRVVALVDMDCFYCQVEARLNPALKGKPMAVVQYNQWKGGGIIAVNYEARDRGVTRYMRGDEAKEVCPEITLVSVPTIRGKADLSNYRDAGDEVAEVISEFSDCVQRASIDEAYLDLTKAVQTYIESHEGDLNATDLPNTFVVGYCDLKNKSEEHRVRGLTEWLDAVESERSRESADYHLAVGAIIVEKMRAEILRRTGFHCSAGIAHNKILAKLTAGLHKPKRQTVLPQDAVPELYEGLPVYKVRNLGGKLGRQVSEKLSITHMSELFNFSLEELQEKFDEKTGTWLHNIARGIDLEPVASRLRPESIGCCKNFTGKSALGSRSEVEHWLRELATEISERLLKDLERNRRRAKLLTVSFCQETSMSRCGALNSYEVTKIVNDALELLKKCNSAPANKDAWIPPIKFLGLSASKFTEEIPSIEKYFKYSKDADLSRKPQDLTFDGETQSTSTHCLKSSEAAINENAISEEYKVPGSGEEYEVPGSSKEYNASNISEQNKISSSGEEYEVPGSSKEYKASNISEQNRISGSGEEYKASNACEQNKVSGSSEKYEVPGSSKEYKASNISEQNKVSDSSKENKVWGSSEEEKSENIDSFFLRYLRNKNLGGRANEERENPPAEDEEGEAWISLTEVFPDLTKAESEVVESLPEALQKKFRERLRSINGGSEEGWQSKPEKEICKQCSKRILKSEALIHSDYHAALKLYAELNKPPSASVGGTAKKNKQKESESLSKRKKKETVAPSKKMKSLTAFFAPLTKE